MDVLVTGGGGFLGRHIVAQLVARGDRVRVFCRRPRAEFAALGVETVLGDVCDRAAVRAACRGVETVFHTAAVAGIWGPWDLYHRTNVGGTQNVVEGCRAGGVRRLVFTSSPSVTFDGSDQSGIDESAPYSRRWLCHYPHSKALAEQAVLAANDSDRLLTCALRPHLIWGPGDPHLIPRVIQRARRGRMTQIGNGGNRIDTVYVENAAAGHLLAADALAPGSPVAGRAYFISQGEPVDCWRWIAEIVALAGLSPTVRKISFSLAWQAGAALEAMYRLLRLPGEPPLTRFLAAQLARSHYFRIDRARHDFGYDPQITMAEGMRRLGESLHACG